MTWRLVWSSETGSSLSPDGTRMRISGACGSFQECLVRELREELGIEVVVGELVESMDHEYPERSVHLRFFRCQWTQHEPRLLGCAAFEWVTAGDLKNYAFPAADARLLELLQSDRRLWE